MSILKYFLAFQVVFLSSQLLKASELSSEEICFKTETEYKALLEKQKMPKLFEQVPFYLTGNSFKGKAAIYVHFVNGLIKFTVNAATLIGNHLEDTKSENRATVCLQDLNLKIIFTKGKPFDGKILGPKRINVGGLDMNKVEESEYRSMNQNILNVIDKKERVQFVPEVLQ